MPDRSRRATAPGSAVPPAIPSGAPTDAPAIGDPVGLTSPRHDDLVASSEAEMQVVVVTELPADDADAAEQQAEASAPPSRHAAGRLGLGFWLAAAWIVLLVLLSVFADFLPFVRNPDRINPAFRQGPSAEYWFGTDAIGRDLFSRTVYGARVSLIVGAVSVGLGMLIGGTLGLIAGYFRGRSETVITGAADVMLAYPALVLALALVAFLGQDLKNIITVFTILSIAPLTRITRAATLTFAQREFVLAARTLGATHWRVLTREVLPNVVPPMASFALLAIAIVIVAEGALSFLGLSVEAPAATWGNIISQGRGQLGTAAHISLIPCAVMFLTLLALNFLGDRLRSMFDVTEGKL